MLAATSGAAFACRRFRLITSASPLSLGDSTVGRSFPVSAIMTPPTHAVSRGADSKPPRVLAADAPALGSRLVHDKLWALPRLASRARS